MKKLKHKLNLSKGERTLDSCSMRENLKTALSRKAELLIETLQYNEAGIDLLIEILNDPELIVRAEAYTLLQSIQSNKAYDAISQGILLNPGDNIYCVYESVMEYNDNWWYIINSFYDILFNSNRECTSFVSFHINKKSAEKAADKFHKDEVSIKHNICSWDISDVGTNSSYFRKDFNYTYQWCKKYNIPVKLPNKNYSERESIRLALSLEDCLAMEFLEDKKYDLLAQLWLDALERFAFVQPMVVQETTYLKLSDNI
ncbi:MAG: hypothetical protein ACFCAD_10230 [Pleurocapsa sp.]